MLAHGDILRSIWHFELITKKTVSCCSQVIYTIYFIILIRFTKLRYLIFKSISHLLLIITLTISYVGSVSEIYGSSWNNSSLVYVLSLMAHVIFFFLIRVAEIMFQKDRIFKYLRSFCSFAIQQCIFTVLNIYYGWIVNLVFAFICIYCLFKENGEHCQVSYVKELSSWLFASKNVAVIARSPIDLENHYHKERFIWAKMVGDEFFKVLARMSEDQR